MNDKEKARKKIAELVDRFTEQYESYKRAEYNETLTRRDFIDPFFKALGWDIDNESGYAEAYREVIHEDKVKVGKATKAPDYSFRIGGGKRLFFVEAKKPSVQIKDEVQPAYQIRRYGWSAKLPISIITDFEEFSIYDCTKKPTLKDKASVARIKYLTFKEYISEFDFLWNSFSKECVLKGSFDKFVKSDTLKKGTTTVDKEFLSSLDNWRKLLAGTISKSNKNLDEEEINYCVQQLIDRIIFLRIAEDRSIEPYEALKGVLIGNQYYDNLYQLFHSADQKYNSGLFDFKKDKISKHLTIDNKVLKTILNDLYYPESPYEFSVISVEILGNAYEQFLGKVIRVTPSHGIKIESKPEVKKAGGVYYTPEYVVEYIVRRTLGTVIEGKSPKEISRIKVIDPACGSGSFLIGAYQFLLDYHKNYYIKNEDKSRGGKNGLLTPDGNLTTAEKKRILLNNIFGVDIDVNAVEVTKLSLLLKCMEGETAASIETQTKLFHERVLPTLDNNIKSGNSLVQNSYLQADLGFEEPDFRKSKTFEWREEFPHVFANGGFDIVIGNPPYSAKQSADNKYLTPFYKTVEYKCDLYAFFVERALQLLKEGGYLGYIIPVSWMTNIYFKKLREHLLLTKSLLEVNLIEGLVFDTANIDTNIIVLHKHSVNSKKLRWINSSTNKLEGSVVMRNYNQFKPDEGYTISPETDSAWYSLKKKLDSHSTELGKIAKISLGMKLRSNDEFVVTTQSKQNPNVIVFGKDIAKYEPISPTHFFNFSKAVIIGGTKNPTVQEAKTKIFIQAIRNLSLAERIIATLDTNGYYFIGTVNSVILHDSTYEYTFILGLLNSKLHNCYFKKRFTTISLTSSFLGVLPIPIIKDNKQIQKAKEISKFVKERIDLSKEIAHTKLPAKVSQLESRSNYCQRKIDELIYEIFDLTETEIKIIEQA